MWAKSTVNFIKCKHPLIMAHRGDSANIPENTLQAFNDAYDLGVDVIETDLHLTKDNYFVFMHDGKVNRTTNGNGRVNDFNLNELKELDAGYKFKLPDGSYPFRGKGLKIWTVDEIIPKYPNVKFNFDIKDKQPTAPSLLALKIKELDVENRIQVGSFNQSQIIKFREYSNSPTSAGVKETWNIRKKANKWLKSNDINDINFDKLSNEEIINNQQRIFGKELPFVSLAIPEKIASLRLFSNDFFKFSHFVGIAIYIWTINNTDDMKRLLDWGVDGIFTDKPGILTKIIAERYY